MENEDYKILWTFSIQIDHVIEARRLDLVEVDKKRRTSGVSKIKEKEKEKLKKYQNLRKELQKNWKRRAKIIP